MADDSSQADVQAVGYLLVDKSLDHQHQYFYLASRQFVTGRHIGRLVGGSRQLAGVTMPMAMSMQLDDAPHQFFFRLTDVQCQHACQLRTGFARGQHDGLGPSRQEERRMLEVHLRRDEVVGIHVGRVVHKGCKRGERTDDGARDQLFEQAAQPQAAQGVGVDDGDFGSGCHNQELSYGYLFPSQYSAAASAHRSPSTPAETMPPA